MSETPPSVPYQVLARKYRPQRFEDLLGHDAMVRTLRHAFAAGRIAHAFILTGVRGVGKTTTARIMARALNYETETVKAPSIDMPVEGRHCRAIAESRHPDVFEMDAASRTGVGDIRELIEGVRYGPVEGRYKVYIIDEVHMLSTNAFNALLKTLEEPPPHVKFIFATTEIRKVPVTVLSRCQRFDLRRFAPAMLAEHLAKVAAAEGVAVEPDALALLAEAAEGSVRDAVSLLDQAIVQNAGAAIGADALRDMLGLVDRTRVWDLLEAAMRGQADDALGRFRDLYAGGADPAAVLRDLLHVLHLLTRVAAAGPQAGGHGDAGEADAERARSLAAVFAVPALTRGWSLLLRALEEAQTAPDAAAAAEIGLIRLAYAAALPTPADALRALDPGAPPSAPAPNPAGPRGGVTGAAGFDPGARLEASGGRAPTALAGAAPARPHPIAAPTPAAVVLSLEDVAALAERHRDVRLQRFVETGLLPIRSGPAQIEVALVPGAQAELVGALTRALRQWTGAPFVLTLGEAPADALTVRAARDARLRADPLVAEALALFPGARIAGVRPLNVATPDDQTTD